MFNHSWKTYLALVLLVPCLGAAADELPQVSHDGLHLVPNTRMSAVYMRPGADLGEYDKIALLEPYVAFRKNWQRDHNRDSVMDRITDSDMKEIRERVAEEFTKIFIEVLSTEGGHEVVKEGASGVLIIRPAIINLDVVAPDTMQAGRSYSVSSEAGSMTLYLELYDGKTGDIIARGIDPERVDDSFAQIRNRVTNRADADRVLRRWAGLLNNQLADVK